MVTKKLLDEYIQCAKLSAEAPARVYLGECEHAELMSLAKQLGFIETSATGQATERLRWNGIPVYKVDTTTFLQFGWNAPSPCG